MMNQLRIFNYEQDAPTVIEWGKAHTFPLPPQECLPDIGYIANETAAGFLYTTNSRLAWMEWVFADPKKSKEERAQALDTLIEYLCAVAEDKGCLAVFSASGFKAFSEVLERNGFKESDSGMKHYLHFVKSCGGRQ
jgi:hypothetical protein